ncbi:MAG: hypothetical protein KF852_03265 [Saprospiraceae bacterium]|nr:hypothetical protein [Saprospiraceae bacterium]
MPIEIRELQIKVTVGEEAGGAENAPDTTGSEGQDAIVKACVEKVLAILEKQRER